jgi:hypothetical protein
MFQDDVKKIGKYKFESFYASSQLSQKYGSSILALLIIVWDYPKLAKIYEK